MEERIPIDRWDAGLTRSEERQESKVARREFERLRSLLETDRRWAGWHKRGKAEFSWILKQAVQEGHQWRVLMFNKGPTDELRRRAAWQFNAVLDAIFRRAYPLIRDERLAVVRPICPFIEPRAARLRKFALLVLETVGEPLDEWRQAAALSMLLCPGLAPILIAPGFWLARPEPNQSNLERQHAAFVGAPMSTERAGVKAKRDWRKHLGFQAQPVKPGPARGRVYRVSQERSAFLEYVLTKAREGRPVKQIVADRDAELLYRAAHRNDSTRDLTEAAVRYALRHAGGSRTMSHKQV